MAEDRDSQQLAEAVRRHAHDIRNPLAGISGAIQIIADRFAAESKEWAVCEEIRQRLSSIDSVVEDLLNVVK